ncbi:MAG TPA: hypothetical protein VJV03_08665, partial [Pyrinomonadaceae bacterium]|nr:hypothetical protein [Pyrinomonadaceae bacterium]
MLIQRPVILLWLLGAAIWPGTCAQFVSAQTPERRLTVAVLEFGNTATGQLASQKLAVNLKTDMHISVQDPDLARAAARGAGYAGSINLSLDEARHIGSVLATDFFLVGDAQTLRRSPSTGPVYFESYASLFLVSSR